MSQAAAIPDLSGNSDLFDATYKLVCQRAEATAIPIEAILCQIIYQAAYELLLSDLSAELVSGVVGAAVMQMAHDLESVDAEGGDQ
ncbi:hypothetical protein [Pseudomonas sp. NBRC 111124]|uniref:hypothetical protein n=1 Tax=Pseudomonas sp. NBRC 111124 TaxID=1661039 RepID=UPI0007612CCA|nr:hypothetical protein [Pseudomonas sp. NBRC 111124]